MIIVREGHQRLDNSALFDEMFRQRASIFGKTLGWDVCIDNQGREIDAYDREDTVYLMSFAEDGTLNGSVRFLNTVTDHMLTGPFHHMFPEISVRSPLIWEATRFYTYGPQQRIGNHASQTACELLLGMCEFGLNFGVAQVIALMEASVIRVYRRCGLSQKILGRYQSEHGLVLLGLWTISTDLLASMREATGISETVTIVGRPGFERLPLEADSALNTVRGML
jgi:acyl homoserine lactone synthase